MLSRLVIALVVGVVVFLVCILVGSLLVSTTVEFLVTLGDFLRDYASLIGLLAALYQFFAGGFNLPNRNA